MFNLTLRVSSSKRRSAISVAVVFTLFASVTSKFRPDIYSFGSASTRPTTILRSASSLAHSAMGGSSFRQWAVDNKAGYLEDVQAGHGKNWTVVMGNEAGDLDSLASALAYAWMATEINKSFVVPLVQTPRPDLNLRAENSHALSLIGFEPLKRELLTMDDIYNSPAPSTSFPSSKFALVDHNRLGGYFLNEHPDAKVVAIVDHHQDEGLYKDTANPRMIVVPTGSASSLVTLLIEKNCPKDTQIPPELATLLLCSIAVDTHGLKSKSKTEKTDIQAVTYLIPRSTLASTLPPNFIVETPSTGDIPQLNPESKLHEIPALAELTSTLSTKKESVLHLGTRDLLRRDYKEYNLTPSWDSSSSIQLGLASVPTSLKSWLDQHSDFWTSMEKWMVERNLGALGILTSFREEPSIFSSKKAKHLREMLMIVNAEAANGELKTRLFEGLEASEELDLQKFKRFGVKIEEGFKSSLKAKVYKQGNADATRKVTAPLVTDIIEGKRSLEN